jgi:hypothetical protein
MLLAFTSIDPVRIEFEVSRGSGRGGETLQKAQLVYRSIEEAQTAFERIGGVSFPDKQGKPQKRIYLRDGSDHVVVRSY